MDNKLVWLDDIRAIACIMVVVLHTAAIYILKSDGVYWEIANLVDSFTRICVPLFFMISGYLFFSEKQIKIKNFVRIIIPLVFYSVVGFVFVALAFKFGFVPKINYYFFSEPIFYHLWYFYPLLLIYAISYFIKVRLTGLTKINLFSFVFLIFVFCNPEVNEIIKYFFDFKYNNYFFIKGEFFYFLSYALIGALMQGIKFSKTHGNFFIFLYFLLSLIIAYMTSQKHDTVFYSFTGPLVCFSAISFFIFFKSRECLNFKGSKYLMHISKFSLGIYGIHAFVLLVVEKIFNIKTVNPIWGIAIFSVMVLALSLIYSFLLKKFDKNGYVV
ncbi:hypothetical protein F889_03619 [Acinetobacter colistiniresistens]|uniref:Acyltransferase 3 domain-containing protein n=1 Tax=Acinetobacter colistiniresistens TaxID=280145 RepID=N9R114_9GAMM|nr:acyltransferase family protein [Acinetobacter colistiniresistens]ENX32300.1 hypothetical protein F889_03619 [Acinetobacter colistiniresistens]